LSRLRRFLRVFLEGVEVVVTVISFVFDLLAVLNLLFVFAIIFYFPHMISKKVSKGFDGFEEWLYQDVDREKLGGEGP